MRSVCAVIATLLFVVPAVAQRGPANGGVVMPRPQPPPTLTPLPAGPASVTGRVVDRDAGQPIANAPVFIRQLGGRPAVAVSPNVRALENGGRVLATNAAGQFAIDQIPFGDYVVTVIAEGFASDGVLPLSTSNQQVRLTEATPTASLVFNFSKLSEISGVVSGDGEKPLQGVAVRLLQRMSPQSIRPIPTTATTGADGVYRFTSVPPGDYAVSVYSRSITIPAAVSETYRLAVQSHDEERVAARLLDSEAPIPRPVPPRMGFTAGLFQLSVDDAQGQLQPVTPGPDGVVRLFPTTYGPSLTSLADVRPVTIKASENRTGLDIHLHSEPTFRISGTLTGPEESISEVGLHLIPAGMDRFFRTLNGEAAVTVSDAAGRFTFLGVPPGEYTIEMHSAPYPAGTFRPGSSIPVGPDGVMLRRELRAWAQTGVTVKAADVVGLSVPTHSPLFVKGRVEFQDAGEPTSARPPSGGVRITLSPDGGQRMTTPMVTLGADDTFVLGPIFPNTYSLRVAVMGRWRVMSAIQGTEDYLGRPMVLVDRDLTGLVIRISTVR